MSQSTHQGHSDRFQKAKPPHDKTNKVSVHSAKTQISLGIRPVWSESSLSAWRKLGSLATHWVHSEDSDQTGRMPRLIWVFAWRTLTLLVLSCYGSGFWGRGSYNVKCKQCNTTSCDKWPQIISSTGWTFLWGPQFSKIQEDSRLSEAAPCNDQFQNAQIIYEPPHVKTSNMTCAQQRLRSAWASADSDQSLRCALHR